MLTRNCSSKMCTNCKSRRICLALKMCVTLCFCLTIGILYCVWLTNFNIFPSPRLGIPVNVTKLNVTKQLNLILKEQFIAMNLTFENETLKLFGHYKNVFFKHVERKEQNIQLDIHHVHPLILELVDKRRNETKHSTLTKNQLTETGKVMINGSDTLYRVCPKENTTKHPHAQQIYDQYFKTNRNVKDIDCKKLFENDKTEQTKANDLSKKSTVVISPEEYINITKHCKSYIQEKGYILDALTPEEKKFPIAYSILTFKDVEQFEKLLRAIYRPQNYYCIHVDMKSSEKLFSAVSGIASCFENVFTSSKRIDVQWGKFSVLQPELNCMHELLKYKWKYFINLTGQEFPLRTNKELVQILNIYNGANDLEGTLKRANKNRWGKAGKPPHNIQPVKGSVHITVNRDFVEYIVRNKTAHEFLHWIMKVDIPDEAFFTTLNHNPQLGIRGSYKGDKETDLNIKPFLTRFKNWGSDMFKWPCHGNRVRDICVFGVGDLPMLQRRPEFFANKFHFDYQPYALKCWEELHFNRTRDESSQKIVFNTTFYKNLQFIKNVI